MKALTMIVPYYRNPEMLKKQIEVWNQYPAWVLGLLKIIVVDDGSPEPAQPIIEELASEHVRKRLSLYRILVDIPWNRHGARNLAAKEADTEWILQIDIDHVLIAEAAQALLGFEPDPLCWYRLPRWRWGKADETRRKDHIPDDLEFGEIHPHTDSYLCTKALYWDAGGYDEDFCGVLGGGMRFVKLLGEMSTMLLTPSEAHLVVVTRDKVADASDLTLSRDTSKYRLLCKEKDINGPRLKGQNPIRFPWERQL